MLKSFLMVIPSCPYFSFYRKVGAEFYVNGPMDPMGLLGSLYDYPVRPDN